MCSNTVQALCDTVSILEAHTHMMISIHTYTRTQQHRPSSLWYAINTWGTYTCVCMYGKHTYIHTYTRMQQHGHAVQATCGQRSSFQCTVHAWRINSERWRWLFAGASLLFGRRGELGCFCELFCDILLRRMRSVLSCKRMPGAFVSFATFCTNRYSL